MLKFMKAAAGVLPTARQREWFDLEFYAFVHFSPNTYTGREWGLGDEDERIFCPEELDCDEWVEAVKSAGMRGIIITAKHHDGFCLWQTKTTKHSVASSGWRDGKGDVVKEVADACRRGGIKFGFYLSPWDRNAACYGTPEYNDFYKAQLTELLTGYGDVFEVWFDGACGEGPNGKLQEYDFDGYIDLIRRYQPNAVIFNDHGPDVRWCGNESGHARRAEWAVVPHELCYRRTIPQTEKGPLAGSLEHMYNTMYDIGSLSNILYSRGLVFAGSEIDMSIRKGWFYHPEEEPHSLERLVHTYLQSVGGNACFNLNIPPMPSGRFDPRDIARLKELGDVLHKFFANPIDFEPIPDESVTGTQSAVELHFDSTKQLHFIVLAEDLARHGQRIESFMIQTRNAFGKWECTFEGATVGHKKICPVHINADAVRIFVTAARDVPVFRSIQAF